MAYLFACFNSGLPGPFGFSANVMLFNNATCV